MKAFLLAAGKGTRLHPLTSRTPKCLVPIDGMPLLGIWFRLLRSHGIDSVLVNTHHFPDQVRAYVEEHAVPGLDVRLVHEAELLGTAGTVAANPDFVEGEDAFFILYADNLTDVDLTDFQAYHARHQSPFTMGLFETPEPKECGIARCDGDGRIVDFEEKPAAPQSNLANSGLYIAGPELFTLMPDRPFVDFGFDLLPRMVGRMYGYRITNYFCDLGTMARVERARREWCDMADTSFLVRYSS